MASDDVNAAKADSSTANVSKIRFVTLVGLVCNLGLTIAKLVVGYLFSSQALVAEGVHSLSDLATDFLVIVGVKYWSAPPDECHPYGHGKIETLVTATIGLTLALAGFWIGWSSLSSLQVRHEGGPGLLAFVVAVVSIALKETLYQWTKRVGVKIGSQALVANAWHHRCDSLSCIPVAVAIALAVFFPSLSYIDHVGAFAVSIFILHAAWAIIKPTLLELSDASSLEHQARIQEAVRGIPGVMSVHAVRTRRSSAGVFADLHIMVDGSMSVKDGHEIAKQAKTKLLQSELKIVDVIVHIEPYEKPGQHIDNGKPNYDL